MISGAKDFGHCSSFDLKEVVFEQDFQVKLQLRNKVPPYENRVVFL